jgi:membrane protein DedA with SNARE-associated domain
MVPVPSETRLKLSPQPEVCARQYSGEVQRQAQSSFSDEEIPSFAQRRVRSPLLRVDASGAEGRDGARGSNHRSTASRQSGIETPEDRIMPSIPKGTVLGVIAFISLQVDAPLSYLIAFSFPALDAVLPVVPSETAIIALGVSTATSSGWLVLLLVALSATGAFAGDNVSYLIGRRFGPWAERHLLSGEAGVRRRAWAERALARYGGRLIVACRFVPGGRTAVTLTCGAVAYPRRRFLPATALGGLLWAGYAFSLGRLGGRALQDRPWLGLLLALGAALLVGGLIELIRRALALRHDHGDA